MSDIVSYLKDLKKRAGIKTDRDLAIKIGISGPAMSSIMAGMSIPADETCIKISRITGDDAALVIALAHKSKASDVARPHWNTILRSLGHIQAGLLAFALLAQVCILC